VYRSTAVISAVLDELARGDQHQTLHNVYYELHTTYEGHMRSTTEVNGEVSVLRVKYQQTIKTRYERVISTHSY
jgi:hypothetical protein